MEILISEVESYLEGFMCEWYVENLCNIGEISEFNISKRDFIKHQITQTLFALNFRLQTKSKLGLFFTSDDIRIVWNCDHVNLTKIDFPDFEINTFNILVCYHVVYFNNEKHKQQITILVSIPCV